ncbi:MAG: hypothetical protein RL741_512 [Actinomycetota bacterium]
MSLSCDSVESLVITHPLECVTFFSSRETEKLFNVAQTLDQERLAGRLPAS